MIFLHYCFVNPPFGFRAIFCSNACTVFFILPQLHPPTHVPLLNSQRQILPGMPTTTEERHQRGSLLLLLQLDLLPASALLLQACRMGLTVAILRRIRDSQPACARMTVRPLEGFDCREFLKSSRQSTGIGSVCASTGGL
jgi:hypothetical protein